MIRGVIIALLLSVYGGQDGMEEFKSRLALAESGNNPNAVGLNHYRGLYSIGRQAAEDVGVPYDSLFIPRWNELAMLRLMGKNWRYLGPCPYFEGEVIRRSKDYHPFVGSTVDGVMVTKAGMLAAAHLLGHIRVKLWLDSGGMDATTDLNGKTVRDYMKLMEGVVI